MTLPSLRERSDLIELSNYLMEKLDSPSIPLSSQAKEKLQSYH
jgi:sigma-54 dependent transcriptional regulator, acetoin dehydrogenase operon transcriptional activator AcoR